MARFKFAMSQLHKDWKQAKEEAPKMATQLKDGNADLALKRLYKDKFKSGLGDQLDKLAKAAKEAKAAQVTARDKPLDDKLQAKLKEKVKGLTDIVSAALRVVTEYKNAVVDEKKELGGVYDFLKKKLEAVQTSAEGLLDQGRKFEKSLDEAKVQATTLYQSVILPVRKSRSFTDAEWSQYLAQQYLPKVKESWPSMDFDD